tara:strand:- start:1784 stop:4774 length:2991 start_codon:yes stop_codon:yes gene_type:complete
VKTYNLQVTDDLTVPIRANSQEEAIRILKSEIAKKEASPLFDKTYFDYETGINVPRLRATLARQEKRTEKENVLRSYVDSSGFTVNTKGDYAITPEGQKVLVEKGLLDKDFQISDKNIIIDENKFGSAGDYADFAGAVGPIAGAILALSPHFRIASLATKIFRSPRLANSIAVGIGSAAGKGAEEALDIVQGFEDKDANETADLLRNEFLIGSIGQGVFELGGKALGAFFGRKAPSENIRDFYIAAKGLSFDDVAKLDADLGREATEREIMRAVKDGKVERFTPGIPTQTGLGASIRARMQAAGETIFGKTKREQGIIGYNIAALNQLKRKLADKKTSLDEYSKFAESDSKVISELRARRSDLTKQEEQVTNELNKLLKDLAEETGGFGDAAMMGARDLGENVKNTISDAYNEIQSGHRAAYKKIEDRINAIDPENTIDVSDVVKHLDEELSKARGLIQTLDDTGSVKTLVALQKVLRENPQVTLSELVDFRKVMRGLMDQQELGGIISPTVKKAFELFDNKIKEIPNNLNKLKGPDKAKVTRIVKDLRRENILYYKNHVPFDNAKVQKILNQKDKMEGDDVYNLVFGVNQVADMRAILNALPVGKRAPLRQSLLRRYVKEASRDAISDPITGQINPARFANKILKDRQKLTPLLGNRATQFFQTIEDFTKLKPNLKADDLVRIADELSGRIPQMDATTGAPESFLRFIKALENKAKTSAEAESLKKAGIFNRLENASPEEISKILFRPKSSDDILRVKAQVTDDAFADIQEQALEQILKDSVQTGSSKLNDIFKPGNLERALTMYGDETLEAMFGKDLTQSLKAYARQLRTTVGEEAGGGAGTLVAGALALNVFNVALWPTIAALGIYKQIFSNPRIVSLLAKQDRNSMIEVLRFVGNAVRLSGFRELGIQTGEANRQVSEAARQTLEELGETEEASILGDIVDQTRSGLQDVATQTTLALPEINPVGSPRTGAPAGPTVLPNPQDVELASRLGQ